MKRSLVYHPSSPYSPNSTGLMGSNLCGSVYEKGSMRRGEKVKVKIEARREHEEDTCMYTSLVYFNYTDSGTASPDGF